MLDYTKELDDYDSIAPISIVNALREGDTPVDITLDELKTII